jgi:hypothetical protein
MRGNIGAEIDVIKPALPAQTGRLAFPNADESFANALVRARGAWYGSVSDAVHYVKLYSRSHGAVIRVYDAAGNVIETHEHAGEFKEW